MERGMTNQQGQHTCDCAAGPWQTTPPPKDGRWILARFGPNTDVVRWAELPAGCSDGTIENVWLTDSAVVRYYPGDRTPDQWAELRRHSHDSVSDRKS